MFYGLFYRMTIISCVCLLMLSKDLKAKDIQACESGEQFANAYYDGFDKRRHVGVHYDCVMFGVAPFALIYSMSEHETRTEAFTQSCSA